MSAALKRHSEIRPAISALVVEASVEVRLGSSAVELCVVAVVELPSIEREVPVEPDGLLVPAVPVGW